MFTNEEAKTATKMTIADLATKLGVNATGSTTVTVTKKDDDGNVVKDDDGNEVTEEQQVDTYTFKLNGKEFTMNADKTVADMLSEINGADLGVKASFNVFTGEFSIEAKNTGTSGNISIEGEQDDLLAGIFKNSLDADGKINVSGTNAIINFEGNDESFEYESNQFTIDGYTFNILKDSTSSVDVTSKVDTDGMVSKITKFVNAYNDLMSTLQKYAYTKPDSDYTALTDDEKKEMTTSQIEEYEEKAKEGLLYGDSNIKKLMTNLRSLFTSTTSESGLKFYQIGIKTSAYSSSGTWGKVEIDETKLRNALETNSDDIASMFTTSTTSGSTQTQGIAVAMKTYTQSYQNNYKFKVSTRQSTKLSNMKEVLEKLKDQLADKEDRLYTKYSNMETSISSLSSQSSFLFSS
jgi:flagellar hook-associated protein 2